MIHKNANAVLSSIVISFSFVAALLTTSLAQAEHNSEHSIIERIKPVGEVCVAGEDCDSPAVAAASPEAAGDAAGDAPEEATTVAAAGRSGEEVYNQSCAMCHAAGVAGAPVVGDQEAWAPRIDKGMEQLMESAFNGLNAMPPRGTCGNCSDEELRASVEFMVEQSQ